jgi:hypothetical protein
MPVLKLDLKEINAARRDLAELRGAQRAASAQLLQAQSDLERLLGNGADEQQRARQEAVVEQLSQQVREGNASTRGQIGKIAKLSETLRKRQENPALLVQALSTQQPVMLMPVAVQTRYTKDTQQLMIRVYPDALHTMAHEPGLTPAELEAGKEYWRLRFATPIDSQSPWAEIARRYRPARAAWIVRQVRPTNLNELDDTLSTSQLQPSFNDEAVVMADPKAQAVYATALPDRFVAIGFSDGMLHDQEIFRVWGSAVPDLLPMSPALDPAQANAPPPDAPEDYDAFGDDLAWMVNFDAAVKLGMGLRVTQNDLRNGAKMSDGVAKIIVLGVDWTQTPDSAAELIAELLDNHQSAAGLKFVPQGTPTNNTSGARSGYAEKGGDLNTALNPTAAAARAAVVADELSAAGARFQEFLGLPKELFDAGLIPGGDLQEGATAGHMLNALWKSTLGYTLRHFWNPIDSAQSLLSDAAIEQLRAWCVRYLRPSGPLSALRVGKQPYGILPITARAYVPHANAPLEREVAQAVTWFRGNFEWVQHKVPTLQDPSSESLHQVLAMQPWSVAKNYWQVMGPAAAKNFPDLQMHATWQSRFMAASLERLLVGKPDNQTLPFVATCTVVPKAHSLNGVPWVMTDPNNATRELEGDAKLPADSNFIAALLKILTTPATNVRAQIVARQNAVSLLEAMLAFAADEEFLNSGQQVLREHLQRLPNLTAAMKVSAQRMRTAEYVGTDTTQLIGDQHAIGHAKAVLGLQLKGTTGSLTVEEFVGAKLSKVGVNLPEHMSNIASFNDSLAALQDRSVAELSMAFRTTLDLYAHRLDAWITSLATRRLDQMRDSAPKGLHIGAFGIVENLVPDSQQEGDQAQDSLGYVHAPSLQQATAAAILRSGHVANRHHGQDVFNIDLRSRRVKRAKRLLEGLANGQSMAALLGYRFERGLRDASLSQHILEYRKQFPLKPTGPAAVDQPQEAISARDAVDGVRLLHAFRTGGMAAVRPFIGVPASDDAKTKPILDDLLDQMDAVSDLLISESVFQMAGGNLDGASATMTAIDKQERPPDTRVADTPHSVRGYTQRVVVALSSSDAGAWPSQDLSAQLEPRLNAWLARLLGNPARYVFNARVLKRTRVENPAPAKPTDTWNDSGTAVSVSLTELGMSPLWLVLNSESEQPGQGSGQSAVQERVGTLLGVKASAQFPGVNGDELALVLEANAPADAAEGSLGLVAFESFAWLLRRLLNKSRPLRRMDMVLAKDGVETTALLADGDFAGVDLPELKQRLMVADLNAQAVLNALTTALPAASMSLEDVAALDPKAASSLAMFTAVQGALQQAYELGWRSALATGAVSELGRNAQGEQVLPADSLLLAVARGRALFSEVSARRDAAPAPTDLDKDGNPVAQGTQATLAVARIQAIVGKDFPVLPRFSLGAYATEAAATLADRDTLLGITDLKNDQATIAGWLPKLACVREATALLSDVLTAAEGLGQRTGFESGADDLKLLQFPRNADAHWAALPPAEKQVLRGVVAVVAHAPDALNSIAADDTLAGLYVDEWMESIPSLQETTGLGFHFDAPGARPPQSILLAVPADSAVPAWTLDALLGTVQEALALAKLRAVRPQDLEGLGLILPGIYLSNNYQRDVPSVDFSQLITHSMTALRADAKIGNAAARAVMASGKAVVSD